MRTLVPAAFVSARLKAGRTGIAARMGTAFGIVAVLAVLSNLIVEHGVLIVRTETVDGPAVIIRSPEDRRPPVSPAPDANALLTAMGRYDRALLRRAASPAEDATAHMSSATAELRIELADFLTTVSRAGISNAQLEELASRVLVYQKHGEELVAVAHRRRQLFAEYWNRLERVDARIKDALDRTWRIFGRIIARESLIALSRDVAEIRRQSARLSPTGTIDRATIDGLIAIQGRFASALERHARGLGHSQATQWIDAVRNECGELIASRNALILTDEEAHKKSAALDREARQIFDLLRTLSKHVADHAASEGAKPVPAPPLTEQTRVTTTRSSTSSDARMALLFVSATMLILLLFICARIVRSIVVPIHRMIDAAGELARGQADARMRRGGLRELDSLAIAFNDMADQLAAVQTEMRNYQAQLEQRVEERTRQLQHLAEHDALTGLPNRRQFLGFLHGILGTAQRRGGQVGVFFLDLDNFKNINDSMGHAFGDRLLVAIAERLHETTRNGGFAARLGGDEFTVLHEGLADLDEVARLGGKLVSAFQRPLVVEEREILIGVSVGASVYPDHARDAEALLRAADAALFQAKTSGRSRLSLFNPTMLEAATVKFRVEQGLRRAVDRGEFQLLFQPEVSFASMGTELVEALLRWQLPDGRSVAPAEFLAVAEQSGLMNSISDWVLSAAIESAARWHAGRWPEVRIAINVSAQQLLDHRFTERLATLLERQGVPARCVEIELTETVLQTGPTTIATLHALRELGIAIALDDFGTGYSSLTSLEQLPLTRVKLDRTLISSIHTSARSLAIARAIVGLCGNLGLAVTAEGIERPEQLAVLMELPPMALQGYLISVPAAAEEIPNLISGMPQRLESLLVSLPVMRRQPAPTIRARSVPESGV